MPAYIVRHGVTRLLGEFLSPEGVHYHRDHRVIIASPRGTEVGTVLCESNPKTFKLLVEPTQGEIIRRMTPEDEKKEGDLKPSQDKAFDVCTDLISQRRMQMDLVDVEWLFGGERAVFYYLVRPPEKRVDFRELVKELARSLHIRIEMRQIGVRDEAKLLADYGDCGKPVCCNTHLAVLPPVNMRMAKLQKSTLDPNKISGRCGRLKCCLRYEFDVYEEGQKDLPPIGVSIVTKQGRGRVLAQEILSRKLLTQYEDGRRVIVPIQDVLSVLGGGPPPPHREREEFRDHNDSHG